MYLLCIRVCIIKLLYLCTMLFFTIYFFRLYTTQVGSATPIFLLHIFIYTGCPHVFLNNLCPLIFRSPFPKFSYILTIVIICFFLTSIPSQPIVLHFPGYVRVTLKLIYLFLIQSNPVTLHIHINILIFKTYILYFLFNAQHSDCWPHYSYQTTLLNF